MPETATRNDLLLAALPAPPLMEMSMAPDEASLLHNEEPALTVTTTLSKTRVWGFGRPAGTPSGFGRPVSTRPTWACGAGSGRKASGSGEFRIFDPTGNALSTSAYGWNRLFQGREYIPMLDAYDFRARTLWPELGRFGQEDPAHSDLRLSTYQALNGSWSNVSDPTGLYAKDFHFYAVYYLARAAGFRRQYAKEVAWASQYVDDSSYTNPLNPGVFAFSRRLQTFHFPAQGQEATKRGNALVRTNLERTMKLQRLIPLGIALHTYADSFGHEGYTAWAGSNQAGVLNRRSWGHSAAAEGGNYPDKPFHDVSKALEAAKDIYEALETVGGSGEWKDGQARPWAEVMRRVRGAFSSAPLLQSTADLQEEARCRVWQRLIEVDFSESIQYARARRGQWEFEFLEAAQAQDDFIGILAQVDQ